MVLSGLIVAEPFAGSEAAVTVSGSLSMSSSLASTLIVTGVFCGVVAVSSTATGGKASTTAAKALMRP
jgi:hypothetical protein